MTMINERDPRKTTVIAEDLRLLYEALILSRRNPDQFRRNYDQYIYKSQQLTEAMRKEYKIYTGESWAASKFDGWNGYTEVLKHLRNMTYHGTPLVLNVSILSVYPAVEFEIDQEPIEKFIIKNKYRILEKRSFIAFPFDKEPRHAINSFLKKQIPSKNSKDPDNYAYPLKEFITYKFQHQLVCDKVISALNLSGDLDAVKLLFHSYPILKK
ncbi:hypothetical protein [Gilvimarinus chinensis]|uniref:hypothetical protein n=1 Tax=Gilvimarinus chinensis TaxID=396005 RepID=UPI0003602100|nr:hypothetical protein [Gilvimarinus chinensis]